VFLARRTGTRFVTYRFATAKEEESLSDKVYSRKRNEMLRSKGICVSCAKRPGAIGKDGRTRRYCETCRTKASQRQARYRRENPSAVVAAKIRHEIKHPTPSIAPIVSTRTRQLTALVERSFMLRKQCAAFASSRVWWQSTERTRTNPSILDTKPVPESGAQLAGLPEKRGAYEL